MHKQQNRRHPLIRKGGAGELNFIQICTKGSADCLANRSLAVASFHEIRGVVGVYNVIDGMYAWEAA